MSTLYIVATPIGNLEDITLRALRVLKEVTLVAAEDTRSARTLLAHYQIATPLTGYTDAYERQKAAKTGALLAALAEGDVALISEAGTPLVSDPGYELVRQVVEAGHAVVPVPGPSAVTAALAASGLPAEPFYFLGFLPRKPAERRRRVQQVAALPATLVLLEAPHRLADSLADLVAVLGPERPVVVAREITKWHEEFWRGTLAAAHAHFSAVAPRGEFTLVVGGADVAADGDRWPEHDARELLAMLRDEGMAATAAARVAARLTRWPRQTLYGWLTADVERDKGDAT